MEAKYPKLALQGVNGWLFVHKHEILYAMADRNYTVLYLTNERLVKVLRKLKEVAELLSDDHFIRIHRSHMINLEHIISFNTRDADSVIMSNGISLAVSRGQKLNFFEKFTRI